MTHQECSSIWCELHTKVLLSHFLKCFLLRDCARTFSADFFRMQLGTRGHIATQQSLVNPPASPTSKILDNSTSHEVL